MTNKKVYQSPGLTVYGNVAEITQSYLAPGSGDILAAFFGDETGCILDPGPLCPDGDPGSGS